MMAFAPPAVERLAAGPSAEALVLTPRRFNDGRPDGPRAAKAAADTLAAASGGTVANALRHQHRPTQKLAVRSTQNW